MTAPVPVTSASGGHDHVEDRAFVMRVYAQREHDRALLRALRRLLPALALLGVAVVIAAIAIPNFIAFNCRAMSSEAKAGLHAMFVAQRSYFAEHDTFTSDVRATGWTPAQERGRYSWYVRADASSFGAVAVGAGPVLSGDVWRIGNDGAIEHLADGCR